MATISGLIVAAAALSISGRPTAPEPIREVDALTAKGQYRQALRWIEAALTRRGSSPSERVALVLRKIQILERLERREEALKWLSSLPMESPPPGRSTVLLLREEAWIEYNLGQYQGANQHLEKALAIADPLGNPELIANLRMRQALSLAKLARATEADRALDRVEDYVLGHKTSGLYPYYFQHRGLIRLMSNQFEEAIPYFERARDSARKVRDTAQVFHGLINLAWCQYRLGHADLAMALYTEALPMAAPGDRHLCLGHIGNILRDDHQYTEAADYYRQAADLARGRDREYYSKWLSNLAGTLCDEGRWDEAQRVNQQALEIKNTIQSGLGTPFEKLNAARIASGQNNTSVAILLYQELLSSETDPTPVLEGSGRLAQLYAQTGQPDRARRQYEQALATIDERRANLREDENRLSYLEHLIDLHQEYVAFLAVQGDQEHAFAVAEASRARLLRDRLGMSTSVSRRQIAEYQAAARAANTTFLSYWIAPEHSYLWKIDGSHFQTIALPGEAEIRKLVELYQAGLEKDRAADAGAGAQLFSALLSKAALQPGGRYVIVPDGPLYGLNLETLPAGPDGHYWLQDATVMVTPSLDLLLARRREAGNNRRLLLVGDADEWDEEFPKLPNAAREIEGISRSFPPDRREVLSGAQATPASYQRAHPEQFGLIHFDAHATASRDYPLDSAIVLSREGDSGKLSAKDVLRIGTQAELVTLSACHSAGARTYAGEGLVGLAWAFLQSGAGNVIAGLWNVSDYSSPRLMEQLYAGLAAGKSPADALHDAKLTLIRDPKYAHPFYWGAFQLYVGTLPTRATAVPRSLATR